MDAVLVVTGGSRGLGAAVATLAARKGYDVCVNYCNNEARANQVAMCVQAAGRRALIYRADVGKADEVEAMFAAVDSTLGRLSVLVNCAGINGTVGRVDGLRSSEIRKLFGTNVEGTLLCCREAVLRMSQKYGAPGGSIINLSSAAARLGGAGRNVYYAASKGAIDSLTFGLAQEVAAEGIRVNAVSPGVIDTEMHDPQRLVEITPKLPMGRPGSADEVANAVMWLASDEASYVSGTVLDVSGAR